jgi:ribokinase
MRVVCAGHVNWDVTLRVDDLPEPDGEALIGDQCQGGGGSAPNVGTALANLGHNPLLLGSVGDDEYADLVTAELTEAGVDCTHLQRVAGRETTLKYLVVDEAGQVVVLANEGANEAYAAADLPEGTLAGADHLHLTGQDPETARVLAERARAAGLPVSFDPGRRLGERPFESVVALADLVFVNDREAETAREQGLLADAATVVCKQGNGGAILRAGDRRVEHPGYDVPATDTAGAGDAFAAGFLAARFDGADDREALGVANACGALAVQSAGARTSLSWAAVDRYRDEKA